jgi:hypothetical protein
MNLQIYTNSREGQMFRRYLARDVNLRGTFLMTRAFSSIVTTAAAIARAFLTRVGRFFIFGRGFRRCSAFPSFLLFN